ncbi:MAG: prepilin-type N-terminal cleavage/methylation domain-containing protein [Gammaproteobacteria bacterium]|nr:prepilin-type N-terminal cleavage/methylation domain-containing protein [Gammaproteobacteria bacterium]
MRTLPTGKPTTSEFRSVLFLEVKPCDKKTSLFEYGFTLVEIMVVCVLVGVISSLAISNLAMNNDNLARVEAQKFAKKIGYLREESMLSGKPMAVGFEGESRSLAVTVYRFYAYIERWKEFDDGLLSRTVIPTDIRVSWSMPSNNNERIIVDPIGLISDFEVSFSGTNKRYDIEVNEELNVLVMEKPLDDE